MNILKFSWKSASFAGLAALASFGIGFHYSTEAQSGQPVVQEIPLPVLPPVEELYPHMIESNTTLYSTLTELDVPSLTVHQIVEAAKPVANLGRIKAGTRFAITRSGDVATEVTGIKFRFSPVELIDIKKVNNSWVAEKITEQVETKVVTFSGIVQSTLWESAEEAQMDPNLISELAEVFSWQVDFAREVRVNDRWRLSVERKYVKGEAIGWGSILAAEYQNAGQLHTAVLFRQNGENLGYFAPDGASLRRMFLKSPIKYGRISSRFSRQRFHPILKANRPHLGVDYAAPTGTPIRAVGSGVITFAAWSGGGGRVIKIRHNSTYETAYKHLSGFAKGIRSGTKVQQGQTIGFVGSTGLSTGAHLHFEFFQDGRFVDPMGKKFPSADPVPATLLSQFKTEVSNLIGSLPAWESMAVTDKIENPLGGAVGQLKAESNN